MSPVSPTAAEPALFTFEIKVDGRAIDSSLQVVSVDTWSAVNEIPRARIVLYDGSPSEGTFPVSNLHTFLPGELIEISAGYGGTVNAIFSGIVIAHRIEITGNAASTLVVEVADAAIKMTVSRNTTVFEKVTDTDLIGQLISASGLSKDVGTSATAHEAVVQYDATDWDMMVLRAEMNGMVVTVDAGKVTVKQPDTSQSPLLQVAYGESILDLWAEMDAVRQLPQSAIKSCAWDSATQRLLESGPGSVPVSEAGNHSSDELAKVCGVGTFARVTGAFLGKDDLRSWASAELLRSRLAKIRGSVRFQGSALAKPGSMITLTGVGERFSGNVFVSAVHHDVRRGRWFTTVDFGLASEWFAGKPSVAVAAAAGQLPPIKGLQSGIVTKVAGDPSGEFRVLVSLPLVRDDSKGVWARLSTFYASNAAGAVFYPEVGDEVVVGFMNEDPRFPIVLGSVYSSNLTPPCRPDSENRVKAIVTRSKMEVSFDETDKAITIRTPGQHVITLNDKSGEISIVDSNRNSVTLGKGGVTIDSASRLVIKSSADIEITAGGNLALKAKADATLEGLQVDVKAQTVFSAQGDASAELKASGVVTVQGALVKIN